MEDLRAGVTCRPVFHYASGQVLETLMRHVLAAVAIALCAGGVGEPARAALLVLSSGLALLSPPHRRRAGAGAILVAAIAATTDEEDLAALETATHGEAQRIHGLAATAKNWTSAARRATKALVGRGSGRTT
jgi:hypothetical protein